MPDVQQIEASSGQQTRLLVRPSHDIAFVDLHGILLRGLTGLTPGLGAAGGQLASSGGDYQHADLMRFAPWVTAGGDCAARQTPRQPLELAAGICQAY